MAEAIRSRADVASPRFIAQLTVTDRTHVAPGARQAKSRRGAATTPEATSFRAAIELGSNLRMVEHRVVGVVIEQGATYPPDPHVVVICLEDGRRIPKARAMTNLRYGVEGYFSELAGVRARLRVVDPCSRCGEAYLRADEGATQPDQLMSLPPCAADGARPSPSGSDATFLPPPVP